MAYCENCGTKVSAKANFCKHCGARVSDDADDSKRETSGKKDVQESEENFISAKDFFG